MALFKDPRIPDIGGAVPRTHGPLAAGFGRLMMRLWGWRLEGEVPNIAKFVLIVAPHTSNWDFPVGLWAKLAMRLKASFLGKHTIFRWPFGAYLRSIGGIAVDRSNPAGVTADVVRAFREQDRLVLVVAPEGTRRRVEKWKSGFYRIALDAGVPILLVAFDYRRRMIRLGPLFTPTGDYEKDLAEIRSHFHAGMARRPENFVEPGGAAQHPPDPPLAMRG